MEMKINLKLEKRNILPRYNLRGHSQLSTFSQVYKPYTFQDPPPSPPKSVRRKCWFFPPHFIATVTKVLANAVRRTNLYSHNGTKIIRMAFAGPFVTVALFSLCYQRSHARVYRLRDFRWHNSPTLNMKKVRNYAFFTRCFISDPKSVIRVLTESRVVCGGLR